MYNIYCHWIIVTYCHADSPADSPADRAQECFDDFGCPHTLEHLIFLGSEQYPFKGLFCGEIYGVKIGKDEQRETGVV